MNEQHQRRTPDADLAHYGAALWRRKWLIALTTAVTLLIGIAIGMTTTVAGSASEGSGSHEASGRLFISNPAVLPENETLELLDVGSTSARAGISHQLGLESSQVIERAVAIIHPDLDPVADEVQFQAAVTELEANFTAEAVSLTNVIEIAVRANGEELARTELEAIVTAYRAFLSDELNEQRQSALSVVQERLDRIEGSSPVAASVLSQLTRAIRDLEAIDESVAEQATELAVIENDIAASVLATTTATLNGESDVNSVIALSDSFPVLLAAAAAINASFEELQMFKEAHEQNVSAAVVALQIRDVDREAANLLLASQRTRRLFDEFANESSISALESDLASYADGLRFLIQTLNLVAPISSNAPVIGGPVAQLRPTLSTIRNDLENRLDTTQVLLITVEEDRRAMSAEAVAASSTLLAVAGQLNTLAKEEGIAVSDLGRLSAAESRLRAAALELQGVESINLLQELQRSSNLVLSTSSQIGAVAQTLSTTASSLRVQLDSGITSSSSTQAVAQTIRAATTNLIRISDSLVTLREGVTGGNLFSELIAVDSVVDQASSTLAETRELSDDSAEALTSLASSERQLRAELDAIIQALTQAAASSESTAAENIRRSRVVQVDSAAETLVVSDELLLSVRSLALPGTDIVGIVNLSALFNSFASDLVALSELSTVSTNLVATGVSVAETLGVISAVDSTTADSAARAVVVEAVLRMAASAGLLDQLGVRLRDIVAESNLQSEVGITLAAQRLTGAKDRLQAVSELLSKIERPSDAEFGELLTLQEEIEAVIASNERYSVGSPSVTVAQVSTIGIIKLIEDLSAPVAIAGVAGILIGIVAVFATEYLDRSVRTVDDVMGIGRLQPIGAIGIGQAKGNPHPPDVAEAPGSYFSESMQLVATEIDQLLQHEPASLLLASAAEGDGRTMLALNAAKLLAQRGKSVLLIDANIRKPDLSVILEMDHNRGLADALESAENPISLIARRDLFDVLPAGHSDLAPIDLLSRSSFALLLRDARQRYNAVIVDGPPALGFPDALVLARHTKAALLVARSGRTTAEDITAAAQALERSGAEVRGLVLNFAGQENFEYISKNYSAYGIEHAGSNRVLGRIIDRLRPQRK